MAINKAYRRTRKDGAVGVDGITAEAYEAHLQASLSDLLERFKSGRYRAPPVRRVHIPKTGTTGKAGKGDRFGKRGPGKGDRFIFGKSGKRGQIYF